ncbi:hypothetical protein HY251_09245 [bacterium]|nr:hypothetical protein [bacterium]
MSETSRRRALIASPVVASAAYSFLVLLLPARGLTFFWDDWLHLARLAREPAPGRWLAPFQEHWEPLFFLLFDLEHGAFGANHTFFLATTWLIHVVNVFLLSRLLAARTGDERLAAIGAAAFGLTTTYREVLWWAELGAMALTFAIVVLGFLAFERARRGERRFLVLALVAVFTAPLGFSSGLALGPALAAEGWLLAPRERRTALALAPLGAWLLHLAVYALAAQGAPETVAHRLPQDASALGSALLLGSNAIGLGVVRRNFVPHVEDGVGSGAGLALAWFAAVVAVAPRLSPGGRRRLVLAQVFLLLLVAPIAATRHAMPPIAGAWSRYQYLPAIAWTSTLALALAPALRRAPRLVLSLAAGGLVALALAHAVAARDDERPFTPTARRPHLALLHRLEAAVRGAPGPVYDAPVSIRVGAFGERNAPVSRASDLLAVIAPETSASWTRERTPASLAPLEADPELAPLFAPGNR